MIVLVSLTIGLVIWIAGWALGIKSFDAFMVTLLLLVMAAAARSIMPYVKERLLP